MADEHEELLSCGSG